MKKLLTVSLVAMMAVTTARAEIASKAYVDQQDGQLSTLKTTAKTNLVAAINELSDKAGATSVADQIAAALEDYTETGEDTNYVSTVSSTGDGNVVSAVSNNVDGTVTVTKGITALTASDIDQTYDGTSSNAQSGTAVAQAITNAGGQTSQQVQSAIDTSIGGLDGSVTGSGNAVATLSQTDGVVSGTLGNVYDKIGTATGDGNVITAISENADGQTIDVVKGITALQASDIVQTYDATSTGAMSGVAVAQAITAAGGQTAQQVSDAIDAALADYTETGEDTNYVSTVSSSGEGNVVTAVSDNANGTVTVTKGITALQASDIVQTYDATSTGAMSGVAVAQAITAAGGQTAQQVSDAINTKVGTLDGVVSGSGNVVTAVTEADGIVTATMGNAILSTDTINENGTWALTATRTGDSAPYTYTYQWELIRRAGQQ